VPLEWNWFGVCHHGHLIYADLLQVAEAGGTCMAESTSMGRSAREGLAVTVFPKISSACETAALSDTTAAVMI